MIVFKPAQKCVCVCVYFYNSLQVIIYTFNYEKGVQSTDMIYPI